MLGLWQLSSHTFSVLQLILQLSGTKKWSESETLPCTKQRFSVESRYLCPMQTWNRLPMQTWNRLSSHCFSRRRWLWVLWTNDNMHDPAWSISKLYLHDFPKCLLLWAQQRHVQSLRDFRMRRWFLGFGDVFACTVPWGSFRVDFVNLQIAWSLWPKRSTGILNAAQLRLFALVFRFADGAAIYRDPRATGVNLRLILCMCQVGSSSLIALPQNYGQHSAKEAFSDGQCLCSQPVVARRTWSLNWHVCSDGKGPDIHPSSISRRQSTWSCQAALMCLIRVASHRAQLAIDTSASTTIGKFGWCPVRF